MGKIEKQNKNSKNIIFAIVVVLIVLFSIFGKNSWKKLIKSTDAGTPQYSSVQSSEAASKDLSVHYIDVEQGDSTLIRFKDYNILIDAGKSDYGDTVVSYLNGMDIEKLDLVIATHPDADHIGGMQYVLEHIHCDRYIMPQLPSNIKKTKTEANLISILKVNKINTEYAVNQKEYDFDDMKLTTFITEQQRDNKNDYSVVAKVTYKDSSFLFMGDAGKTIEKEFISAKYDLKADVLKAGHHGSSKSTSEDFVKYVQPSISVFSCGVDNEYGHPHNEVLTIMNKYDIKYFRTDYQGTVVIGTDGDKYFTATQGKE